MKVERAVIAPGLLALLCSGGWVAMVCVLGGFTGADVLGLSAGVLAAGIAVVAGTAVWRRWQRRDLAQSGPHGSMIGPLGVIARVFVGFSFVLLALSWGPGWDGITLGLLAMPGVVTGVMFLRSLRTRTALSATGPVGHVVNLAVILPLFALPATAEAAFLFYGASMLVAAFRRAGGCEVTAISNTVLNRDDQVGCMFFAPVDAAERAIRTSSSQAGDSTASETRR